MASIRVMVCFVLLFSASARAAHSGEGSMATRPAATADTAPRITGCISKNNSGEFTAFDLRIGSDLRHYEVKGGTTPDQGIYRTDSSFGGIQVTKRSNEDGLSRNLFYNNEGLVKIYPRKRKLSGVRLAGVPVDGYSVSKLFTGSLVMDNLSVDGQPSKGKLQYNPLNGHLTCTTGRCSFGDQAIRASNPGSSIVMNYDNFINTNRMRVSMAFGDLKLDGLINFTDTTRTTTDTDGNSSTQVTATKGCFNVDLTKADGSRPTLAAYNQPETADDKSIRKLIAWFELMAHDLFAQ